MRSEDVRLTRRRDIGSNLTCGIHVTKNLFRFQLVPTDSCLNAITKMLHCSSCKGLNGAKVCNDFCLNVMKGCLGFYTEIDNEWNAFVGKLRLTLLNIVGIIVKMVETLVLGFYSYIIVGLLRRIFHYYVIEYGSSRVETSEMRNRTRNFN